MGNAARILFKDTRQAPWLDGIPRERLGPEFEDWRTCLGVRGMATNAVTLRGAVTDDEGYQTRVAELHREGMDAEQIADEIAFQDAQLAAEMLLALHKHTNGLQGFVSIDVNPEHVYDERAMIEEARAIAARFGELDLPNYMIRIPATDPGLAAMAVLFMEGVKVNASMVFGIKRAVEVARLHCDTKGPACVISFAASRWDPRVDPLIHSPFETVKGKTGISLAKKAYITVNSVYSQSLTDDDSMMLPARLAFMSAPADGSDEHPLKYVQGLIGGDSITMMPLETLQMFDEVGKVETTLIRNYGNVDVVMDRLGMAGVNLDEIEAALVSDGLEELLDARGEFVQAIEVLL